MTPDEIAEIKALAEAATKGPLKISGSLVKKGESIGQAWGLNWRDDLAIFAHAQADVSAIVAEIECLRRLWEGTMRDAERTLHTLNDVTVQRNELQAAVDAVREIHASVLVCGNPRHTNPEAICPECEEFCAVCGDAFPCPTIRALDEHLGGGE